MQTTNWPYACLLVYIQDLGVCLVLPSDEKRQLPCPLFLVEEVAAPEPPGGCRVCVCVCVAAAGQAQVTEAGASSFLPPYVASKSCCFLLGGSSLRENNGGSLVDGFICRS